MLRETAWVLLGAALALASCDTNRTGWNKVEGFAFSSAQAGDTKHSKEGEYPKAWTDYHGYHGGRDRLMEHLKQQKEIEPCFPNCSLEPRTGSTLPPRQTP